MVYVGRVPSTLRADTKENKKPDSRSCPNMKPFP